jgi:hypothetical protein
VYWLGPRFSEQYQNSVKLILEAIKPVVVQRILVTPINKVSRRLDALDQQTPCFVIHGVHPLQ